MNISIFGLGYVGCVGTGCLAKSGHNIIGVDVNASKVNLINNGKSTIVEKKIDDIIYNNYKNGRIKATTDSYNAVMNSDVSIICVGTPTDKNGHLNMEYIYQVSKQIGVAVKNKDSFFSIAIRSTVIPGTNRKVGKIIEEISGKKINKDFGVVSNPEFLREGNAVDDFYNPPYTVLASDSPKSLSEMKKVYNKINSEFIQTDIGSAELIKYVDNSFHALKVSFANEMGRICKKLDVDSHNLMNLFVRDETLNISSSYFKPGFAYGGSCLPKDLKALKNIAHDNNIECPIIESIEESNNNHKKMAIALIEEQSWKKIGFLGLSFKEGTDDLRNSPILEVAEHFLSKGCLINIYDSNVSISKLIGDNKKYIDHHIPHLSNLISNKLEQVIEESEIIVISQKIVGIVNLIKKYPDKIFIDLVRVTSKTYPNYIGICW